LFIVRQVRSPVLFGSRNTASISLTGRPAGLV
jgi:hypothetical protein